MPIYKRPHATERNFLDEISHKGSK